MALPYCHCTNYSAKMAYSAIGGLLGYQAGRAGQALRAEQGRPSGQGLRAGQGRASEQGLSRAGP